MTERERLAEMIAECIIIWECSFAEDKRPTCEELAGYLIAHGVIAPPCKVGDTVYVVSQTKDRRILPFVNEYEVTSIKVGKRKCTIYHEMDGYIKIFKQDEFGRTIFTTREEAEAALVERHKSQ